MIHYGGRGAVVVGEIDGRITPRVTAIRDAWRDFDDRARSSTPNIWGYLWGKEAYGAMLFATALTNESIADALAMPAYRAAVHRAGARDPRRRRRRAASRPRRSTASIRPPTCPRRPRGAAERSLDELVAHNRRSAKTHSGIWRDLAVRKRPTEVDAQLGIVVDARRRGRRADAAHRAAGRADPRDRARRAPAVARHARRARRDLLPTRHRMNLDFSGKTAIVTGAAHGFGRAISAGVRRARRAASGPATCSRTSCARRSGSARAAGGTCTARDRGRARQARRRARSSPRRPRRPATCDILVNNAGGVLGPGGPAARGDHAGASGRPSST